MVSQVGLNDFDSSYWYMPNASNTATKPKTQTQNNGALLQDTVDISGKKKSNTKKVVAGLGIAAALGGIIYCAATGKFSRAKQLAEHIDFKPAETMEDAVKFAKENLGVKLKLDNDLYMANFINESLVKINNVMHGKSSMPRCIKYANLKSGYTMAYNKLTDTIYLGGISKKIATYMQENKVELKNIRKSIGDLSEIIEDASGNCCTKGYLYAGLFDATKHVEGAIFHEMGHLNHFKDFKNLIKMRNWNIKKVLFFGKNNSTKDFMREITNNQIHREFFDSYNPYAFTSPAEYVAEVFRSRFVRDVEKYPTIPEEVQRIYYKYGGPKLDF